MLVSRGKTKKGNLGWWGTLSIFGYGVDAAIGCHNVRFRRV